MSRKIKNIDSLLADPFYSVCSRQMFLNDHFCIGRITLEHALYYAGKRIDDHFAIIPLCAYSHSVDEWQDRGILNKEINEWIAINRMTEQDMQNYPRFDWGKRKKHLNEKLGIPRISEHASI